MTLRVDEKASGERLDCIVARLVPDCSRAYAAKLIRQEKVRVGGKSRKPGYRVKSSEDVRVCIPSPQALDEPVAEPLALDILYEDEALLVLNKPAGMVVHPAPGHERGTLVNALLYHCPALEGVGSERRPGIVHRLDKDTSGLILVAKTQQAHGLLSEQFKSRSVRKIYIAIVQGYMEAGEGSIALPLGRHPIDRKKIAVRENGGRRAETHWRVREQLPGVSVLEMDLKTGRTHQIRVHCAAMQHPIVGDPLYGGRNPRGGEEAVRTILRGISRQMLHAWRCKFQHPLSGATVAFECPWPADMIHLIRRLRSLAA